MNHIRNFAQGVGACVIAAWLWIAIDPSLELRIYITPKQPAKAQVEVFA